MSRLGCTALRTVVVLLADVAGFGWSMLQSRTTLAAENLFLRKQLAFYVEREVKPRRADDATRIALVALSRLVDWRRLLVIVKPNTLIDWHRKGFRSCGGGNQGRLVVGESRPACNA
jgi:putative transposase